jgi:ferredoxin-NADP reductase
MEEHIVKIISIEKVTHDVKRFRTWKPEGYKFIPGQATDVSINTADLKNKKRPFSFTGLNSDPFLEFIIKIYPSRKGITGELDKLHPGDELILRDVWGAINYRGKGIFIAGGAGITPFIAIIRDLHTKNQLDGNLLLYANKTRADIIMESELKTLMGGSLINILSEEQADGYHIGFISENFLKSHISDFKQKYYLCGPPPMMDAVKKLLAAAGVSENSITVEF